MLISAVADGVLFFAGAFEGEAAVLEDTDGAGEVGEGVGEDSVCGAGGFDPVDHGFGGFEGVAVEAELGEDGVANLGGVGVVGPAKAADRADEGCGLVGGGGEEDVAVPADVGGVVGETLLEELEDVRLPVGVGPLGGDAAVEDVA
ncbi:hypothetical protein HDF10_000834 [Edaphobacter lichenicola]|uniref:Uncharacterized protein n=1 Tax=Tunturiibacter lichenicola TaxID=2051959 RepID=A0A7W8J7R5_9BACT|nr:hypothetical protein [Edaphobacter lichenicola]MBB5342884.1 hypothetical protein [Edaphobacter lichenicola]